MPRKGWKNIALPEEIVAMIDKAVKNSKYGFRSRTDLWSFGSRKEQT